MVSFDRFPDVIDGDGFLLRRLPHIPDYEAFIIEATRYRNIFKDNFVSRSVVSIESTRRYFDNYGHSSDRLMYAVYVGSSLTGHYGFRLSGIQGFVLLDNAVRFSVVGGRRLFFDVQACLIDLLYRVAPTTKALVVVDRRNLNAIRLHTEFGFYELDPADYLQLDLDAEVYLCGAVRAPSTRYSEES